MNPIHTIRNAYATLTRRVAGKSDRLVSEDRERLQRRARYEDEIVRGRERRRQSSGRG